MSGALCEAVIMSGKSLPLVQGGPAPTLVNSTWRQIVRCRFITVALSANLT